MCDTAPVNSNVVTDDTNVLSRSVYILFDNDLAAVWKNRNVRVARSIWPKITIPVRGEGFLQARDDRAGNIRRRVERIRAMAPVAPDTGASGANLETQRKAFAFWGREGWSGPPRGQNSEHQA